MTRSTAGAAWPGLIRLAVVTVSLVGWLSTVGAQGTSAPQRFSARTELVLIDVTVFDRAGVPVPDLKPQDFVVTVAGRPRQVHSVKFMTANALTGDETTGSARDLEASTKARALLREESVMVTFVAGLSAFRDGRLAAARALFEQTRRSAPGFAGLEPFLQASRN